MDRRAFLTRLSSCVGGLQALRAALSGAQLEAGAPREVPVRAITRGPGFHWFGYYDKLQFDPDDRLVLGMRVGFEGRTPRATDRLEIGMVDLDDGDAWVPLGETTAWGWQQGCMLQWRPGHGRQVLWNDREDDRYVCRLLDVESGERRTVPHAIYSVAPDGKAAVTADFRRIQALRPGYGYVGLDDPEADLLVPERAGIDRIDLETGARERIVDLRAIAAVEPRTPDMADARHYVNHLLVAPDGRRCIFLHRWRPDRGRQGFRTRMFTVGLDGSGLHLLDGSGSTSHFIWRDAEHVAAWTRPKGRPRGFYVFRDRTGEVTPLGAGVMTRDGHLSYLPGGEWVLNDTYPGREDRKQRPYLFEVATGKVHELGAFRSPPEYRGEWRCDTHPRSSNSGRLVCIDSAHGGDGRQMHLLDVGELVG